MGLYGSRYRAQWIPMCLYGSLWVCMGPYGSRYGAQWIPTCLYGLLWFPIGPYWSLSVSMGHSMGLYVSL